MVRGRIAEYRRRVCAALEAAFAEEHPPGDVAGSFAVGVFITALPTLGTGFLVFVVLVALVVIREDAARLYGDPALAQFPGLRVVDEAAAGLAEQADDVGIARVVDA